LSFARRIIENIILHLQSEFNGINIPKMDHMAISNFPHDGTVCRNGDSSFMVNTDL